MKSPLLSIFDNLFNSSLSTSLSSKGKKTNMTDIKVVADTGIYTVEGQVSGARAAALNKKREQDREKYEQLKQQIKNQNSLSVGRIDDKFRSASDALEQDFRAKTIGLVSGASYRAAREAVDDALLRQAEREKLENEAQQVVQASKKLEREKRRKKMSATLSFNEDDEEDGDGDGDGGSVEAHGKGKGKQMDCDDGKEAEKLTSNAGYNTGKNTESGESEGDNEESRKKKMKLMKNPNVETSFLPDRERDLQLQREKERLRQEWLEQQEAIKKEKLLVVYSYWDGSGHRKEITLPKGTTIGKFLELVKQQISSEFQSLRSISSDSLIYVKEDLIIPHDVSFYDLIITKARGKSGPLFHFDVHDDVRKVMDVRVEKDESHPGKVVERRWYEKNKHIFPASRWEVYDPSVQRDRYTIHGDEVSAKK